MAHFQLILNKGAVDWCSDSLISFRIYEDYLALNLTEPIFVFNVGQRIILGLQTMDT